MNFTFSSKEALSNVPKSLPFGIRAPIFNSQIDSARV